MSTTLTKALLADKLCDSLGITRSEVESFIELFFECIIQTLEGGEYVKLSGFGNFVLLDKATRPGRNPKTGEPVPVSARRVVTFRAGNKLKSRIEQYVKPEAEA